MRLRRAGLDCEMGIYNRAADFDGLENRRNIQPGYARMLAKKHMVYCTAYHCSTAISSILSYTIRKFETEIASACLALVEAKRTLENLRDMGCRRRGLHHDAGQKARAGDR